MEIERRLKDRRRLAALRETGAMDSGREESFDQLCRLAAQVLKAPSAFISLINDERHYIKSSHGDGDNGVDSFERDVSLDISFCKYVVASGEPFVVEDARKEELLKDNDAVSRGVIAYAGVPFHADGQTIGALCVVDSQPRSWTGEDLARLGSLARSVENLLTGVQKSAENESTSDQHLFDAVRRHLKALDAYREIVSNSDIDLEAERSTQKEVTASAEALHREFSGKSGMLGPGMEPLLINLRRYFGADERRRKAAELFAAGNGHLSDLQAAIFEVTQAEDSLRLAALDAGLIL